MDVRRIARGAALPAVLVLALVGALVAVVLISGNVGDEDAPPAAPPFVTPEPPSYSAVDVKQRSNDGFTVVRQITSGTVEENLVLPEGLVVERLTLIEAGDVEPGDWLTVVGVPDPVKNFAAHSLIVIPGGGTVGDDSVVRSAAGFAGHEVARDPRDLPILGGSVLRVEGNRIYLEGPTGEIAVTAGPEAPARLYRVEPVDAAEIDEGDRIAAEFGASPLPAVLLLPGGAAG